jgi:hypothetical protein
MSHFIIRGPRGRFTEFHQYYDVNPNGWGEPVERRESVGVGTLTRKERAILAMERAERRGRTNSPAYAVARAIACQESFGAPPCDAS